jgi:glycerate-2-kinase
MILAINSTTINTDLLSVVERIKLRLKCFNIVAYKLLGGETVVTVRQAAVSVRQKPQSFKEFLKKKEVKAWKVQMPNNCMADMIPLSSAAAYWQYLNTSGKGNVLTKLGEQMCNCLGEDKGVVVESEPYSVQVKSMEVEQCGFPNRKISQETWEITSSGVKQRVDSLENRLGQLEQKLAKLQVQNELQ